MRTDILIVAAATAISSVEAFWGTSHLLVSRRAQDLLETQDHSAYEAVLSELLPLKENYPELTYDEGDHPMTECATFADNIKGQGYTWQNAWHFIDQPYYPYGNNDYPFKEPEYNAVGALNTIVDWLSYSGDQYKDSYYYQTIMNYFPDEENARSFALRLVIHYVGDIHQPLHATTLVDSDYKNGDAGGNFEHLPSIDGAGNLHAVWDSTAYEYAGYPNLPLSSTDFSWYSTEEQTIAKAYPIDSSKLYDGDFQKWADLSFEISKASVYPGVVVGEALSAEYVAQANSILKTQIMYGGYRLNNLLQQIYGSSSFNAQMIQ